MITKSLRPLLFKPAMLRLSKQKRARLTHEKKAKIREKEMKNLPIIKIFNVYTH